MPIDLAQSLENLKLERDAIQLYDALATIEKDPARADAFRTIAGNERRHAEIWATRLTELGATVPPVGGARFRVRVIIALARLLGTHAVKDLVLALEGDEEDIYMAQAAPEVEAIAADEREHAEIWKRLSVDRATGSEAPVAPDGAARAAAISPSARAAVRAGAADHASAVVGVSNATEIASRERWHRAGRSGTLRAVIFGVSDGLVSNLALVMGVAGAGAAIGEGRFILLAGIAGLLAGAFSMAAGEYISMQSQRELFERQIALERAELEAMPDEEREELAAVYRAKGFTAAEADAIATRMFADPEHALDTLVREELGLDPDELGSAWGAAAGSFIAFAAGAIVPVLPYVFGSGAAAFWTAIGASLVALFLVGAGVSLLTGRSLLFSGGRQVGIGSAAAAVTYAVGSIIGVTVAG
ncbi:MAG TPA: VIT1/CCC1 transporter family protein [Candidatus Limnocylindrales bacterium]|jgi:VIT1/CCC1 family predicted Fe2+/Mn2+ transporter/rubrerythrin